MSLPGDKIWVIPVIAGFFLKPGGQKQERSIGSCHKLQKMQVHHFSKSRHSQLKEFQARITKRCSSSVIASSKCSSLLAPVVVAAFPLRLSPSLTACDSSPSLAVSQPSPSASVLLPFVDPFFSAASEIHCPKWGLMFYDGMKLVLEHKMPSQWQFLRGIHSSSHQNAETDCTPLANRRRPGTWGESYYEYHRDTKSIFQSSYEQNQILKLLSKTCWSACGDFQANSPLQNIATDFLITSALPP